MSKTTRSPRLAFATWTLCIGYGFMIYALVGVGIVHILGICNG